MKLERMTLNVDEAAERLGMNRNTVYQAAKRGEIPVIKIGKRILIPIPALEKFVARVAAQPTAEPVGKITITFEMPLTTAERLANDFAGLLAASMEGKR